MAVNPVRTPQGPVPPTSVRPAATSRSVATPTPRVRVAPEGLAGGNTVLRPDGRGGQKNFTPIDQNTDSRFMYACADTCMAMLLNFHLHGGRVVHDLAKVTAVTHRKVLYSSPLVLTAYAENNGMVASVVNKGSIAQIKRLVDQGLPVQVQLDTSPRHDGIIRPGHGAFHNVIVTGYGTDAAGVPTLEVMDPGGGVRTTMDEASFLAKWSGLNFAGFQTGLDRLMTVYKPKGDPRPLPADQRDSFFDFGMAALVPADAVTQVTNGWDRGAPLQVAVGLWNLIPCGLTAAVAAVGHNGAVLGADQVKAGAAKVGTGFWPTLAGAGQVVAGSVVYAATKPASLVGSAATRVLALVPQGIGAAWHWATGW